MIICAILAAPATNAVVDAYSKSPICKPTLLVTMHEKFGLKYEIVQTGAGVNATGGKPHYYSTNTKASEFGYLPQLTALEGVLLELFSINPESKLISEGCYRDNLR